MWLAGGPWGTWVEPSTSARSVIGEKQYDAYVGDTGYKGAMASLQDTNEAKAVKQSLAGVDLGDESYAEALMDPSHPSASRHVPRRALLESSSHRHRLDSDN